jgi:O-antigen/teichoic acid export membrane protein
LSQLKKGAFLNYATIILTNVVGILLTPFMIRQLGNAEYGLYTLIGAFVGYISILDFGLGHTIIRFVAKYRAEKDKEGEENFLATTMLIYLVISILVLITGIICYINIDAIFGDSLNQSEIAKAKVMFLLLIFNLAITLPGGSFASICIGYERFVFPKLLNIVRYIIRSILVVTLLLNNGDAVSIVILDTAVNIAGIIIFMIFTFKKLKVKFKIHKLEKKLIKEIFSYSIWIFVFIIVAQFQWKSGQIVLGILANTTVVAIFAVGIMLGGYYGAFSTAITSVFLPRATQMTVAQATSEELTDMMIRIGRISFIALIYILGAFLLFGKQFILLWVGSDFTDSYTIALMIMIAYTIPLVQGFANAILEARGKLAFKAIIFLIFLMLGTGIGALLAKDYGGIGMISGICVGWIIGQNIMNFYYHKVIGLNILRFFKELFDKTIVALCFSIIIGLAIQRLPGNNWLNFTFKAILFSLIFGTIFYKYAINAYEKNLIKSLLHKIGKR